ncbi:MAG: cyclase family protein [Gemmataceae bacterium]|nr:cyclase family protein [Gemmata sp.]MDW8198911.1 cyclase family protein [Gemmataceae bacterium]
MKPLHIPSRGVDLSIPLDFHGPQPNAYGVPAATAQPYSSEGFTLEVARGGAVNCDVWQLIPHGQTTHTESVGHLTRERFFIAAVTLPQATPCELVSVQPRGREILAEALDGEPIEALVVRTLPNDATKRTRRWENATTPYFTAAAMHVIRSRGVKHLLVDLPSVDPLYDNGLLQAHRIFWDMPPGSTALPDPDACQRTITELIFVPESVADGRYRLTIETPHILTDAVPSRPILYPGED